MMKVLIAADHAGYEYKEALKTYLKEEKGFDVTDLGTNSEESVDYPLFSHDLASKISKDDADRGILVCGSGIGMCMAANRYNGVRAAVLQIPEDAELSRSHNNANVACLGSRITSLSECMKLLDIWFSTKFEGGRHERRVDQIDKK